MALENALRIRERISGRFSLDSAETLNNLAGILRDGGDVDGALEMMAEVLETRRFLMRDDHPLVIQSMAGLAVMAATKGDLARAEALLNEVIELDRRVFGVNHPALGVDLSSLSKVLTLQNRFTEAEPLLRESYEIRKRYLPADHPARLATEVALGRCLMELQKESDGAKFLADALSWSMDSARRGEPFWSGVAKELHSYYTRTGLEAKAAEMAALQK
ncbi:MAG: tetratricopeptide repeat protein [Planctomycetes bacterium]|nr:tetratricopeptide repeat protein [Planctomycetota bacterium]